LFFLGFPHLCLSDCEHQETLAFHLIHRDYLTDSVDQGEGIEQMVNLVAARQNTAANAVVR